MFGLIYNLDQKLEYMEDKEIFFESVSGGFLKWDGNTMWELDSGTWIESFCTIQSIKSNKHLYKITTEEDYLLNLI